MAACGLGPGIAMGDVGGMAGGTGPGVGQNLRMLEFFRNHRAISREGETAHAMPKILKCPQMTSGRFWPVVLHEHIMFIVNGHSHTIP